jgi:hypothetical protein
VPNNWGFQGGKLIPEFMNPAYIGAMGDVMGFHQIMVNVNPDIELDVQNRIEGPKGLRIWAVPVTDQPCFFPNRRGEGLP